MSPKQSSEKINALEQSIEHAKKRSAPSKTSHTPTGSSADMFHSSIELVAGTGVGLFIGYHVDRWLSTTPLFIILCCFLGMAGGMLNIYKKTVSNPRDNDRDE